MWRVTARWPASDRAADRSVAVSLKDQVRRSHGHLRRILETYATYYDDVRTHLSLDKDAPRSRRSEMFGSVVALPISVASTINTFGFEL